MKTEEIKLEQKEIGKRINQISIELDKTKEFSDVKKLIDEDMILLKRLFDLDSELRSIGIDNVFVKLGKLIGPK